MNKPEEEKHEKEVSVLRKNVPYNELFFYQKADAIYQLTYVFCQRFLPKYGDRTVDQWYKRLVRVSKTSWKA